ncbi:hypothetical protein LL974_00555 [Xanthomonas campestris pv. cannae]|nr:hypothetical protein [Xanthomonas campestris pv. cannae]
MRSFLLVDGNGWLARITEVEAALAGAGFSRGNPPSEKAKRSPTRKALFSQIPQRLQVDGIASDTHDFAGMDILFIHTVHVFSHC